MPPVRLHHVICRGIERGVIFQDNADRDDFVNRLGIHQSSVSRAVERGERIASKEGLHCLMNEEIVV